MRAKVTRHQLSEKLLVEDERGVIIPASSVAYSEYKGIPYGEIMTQEHATMAGGSRTLYVEHCSFDHGFEKGRKSELISLPIRLKGIFNKRLNDLIEVSSTAFNAGKEFRDIYEKRVGRGDMEFIYE